MNYRSPFGNRDEDPDLHQPLDADKHFFSTSLTPLLSSEEVLERLPASEYKAIEVHQLYAYLGFTVRLELGPVNEVSTALSHRSFIPQLDTQRRGDAITITRDESKHAQWSDRVMEDVQKFTGIDRIHTDPEFIRQLNMLMDAEPDEIKDLVKLMFVIVSETLITGSLSRLPEDPAVQEAVRSLAAAHAKDEGQHHAYFRGLFLELWPILPRQLQRKLGVLLPSVLKAFLAPDRTYLTRVLERYPQHFSQPDRVVGELINSSITIDGMVDSAKKSLSMFDKAGVFNHAVIRSAFVEHGFESAVGF